MMNLIILFFISKGKTSMKSNLLKKNFYICFFKYEKSQSNL